MAKKLYHTYRVQKKFLTLSEIEILVKLNCLGQTLSQICNHTNLNFGRNFEARCTVFHGKLESVHICIRIVAEQL